MNKNNRSPEAIFFLILIGLHVWTWYYWQSTIELRYSQPAVCWPYFQSCEWIREGLQRWGKGLISAYGLFSVLTLIAGALLWKKRSALLWGNGLLILFKWAILSTDYSFTSNANYFHLVISSAALLSRQPLMASTMTLSVLYFFSAILKLGSDWFTRSDYFGLPEQLGVPLLYIVAGAEALGAMALHSRNSLMRYFAFVFLFSFMFIRANGFSCILS